MKHIYLLLFLIPATLLGQLANDVAASKTRGQEFGIHSQSLNHGQQAPGAQGDKTLKDLWIAPNPSVDFLNVWTEIPPSGKVSIGVYNILGGRLYTFEPDLHDASILLHEDVSNWISGTYLVRIEDDGKVLKTVRFVKR